nr:PucR family transcriptional regulator [uncultured Dorea sp.]
MFQCKDLYTLSSLSKLKLIAGSNGLHKGIRWVYKAESLSLSQWVHGGELLIISRPVSSEPDFNLAALLKEAIHLNMSGALLLIGPNYVEKISKSVLSLCNENEFPLFAIPWNLPLVDFFEEIGHAISNNNFYQSTRNDVIFNIVFENQLSASALKLQASNSGYSFEGSHHFFLLHFILPESGQTARMEQTICNNLYEYLDQAFSEQNTPFLASTYSNHIIGIFPDKDFSEITKLFQKTIDYVSLTHPQLTCNIGVGLSVSDVTKLKQSYEQAAECIHYCNKLKLNHQHLCYNQLGLYQLFSDLNQTQLYESFVETQLGALIHYDADNHTRLVETLSLYLQNNCNILHTADAAYTHRNTIKYRITRIEELLHVDLQNASARLNLHLALYLYHFILMN